MDQTYWVFEFIKVLLAYLFMMYIWPSVVFRRHLSGKGRAYRFCFCLNISILLINTGVLFLGLIHILNQILVMLLFWAVFLVQLVRNYDLRLSRLKDIRSVLNKTMSLRRMFLRWHTFNAEKLKSASSKWWQSTKGRRLEYTLLLVILAFATAYFSTNALHVHSYGATDQYVHHAWIYGLQQGKIFVKGIYPEGMHCYIYLMGTVFPISFYSIILFSAGAYIHIYIVSAYLLGRMLFGWRMSAMLALVGFLTIDQVINVGVTSISRFSCTLPQEFALYTVFMSAYALIGFLRQAPKPRGERFRFFRISSWRRFFSDRYLFVFISAIAVSISVHFYATIIAVFVCIVVVIVYMRRLFRRGVFLRLAAGAMIAFFIAAVPMIGAFVEGYPLQGSLYWAMSVTNQSTANTDTESASLPQEESKASVDEASSEATISSDEQNITENTSLQKRIMNFADTIISGSFCKLYGTERGILLFAAVVAVSAISVILISCNATIRLIRRRKKKEGKSLLFSFPESYLIASLTVFVLFLAYKPKLIGLPSLVEGARLCSTIDMYSMFLYTCFFDIFFSLIHPLLKEKFLKPLSVIACAGIYVFAQMSGLFHGFTFSNLSRYPVAVELTKEIVEKMPKYQYTIISTTDELYQVIETGFHEEWIDFLDKSHKPNYTIPTPYMFFFIEKHPLAYAQYNFVSGPEWLAAEKYSELFGTYGAQYPEILHGEVSEESAEKTISNEKKRSETASKLSNRIILESKAFAWYQKFSEIHPNDGEVIYEDDDFLCYCVHQNEFSLFSLGIMDKKQERGLH